MREGDVTSGDDLKPDEYTLDTCITLLLELVLAQNKPQDQTCQNAYREGGQQCVHGNPGALGQRVESRPSLRWQPFRLVDDSSRIKVRVEAFESLELQCEAENEEGWKRHYRCDFSGFLEWVGVVHDDPLDDDE